MRPALTFRRTKIVCTIGPVTNSREGIRDLIDAGMNVARLNFSHGDREEHRQTIRMIRQVSAESGKSVGILQDLGGPKIRLGVIKGEGRNLIIGESIVLTPGSQSSTDVIPVNYPYLLEDVKAGDRILLADGSVELSVVETKDNLVFCKVLVGGIIKSHKGVNLPSSHLRVPAVTDKDLEDLAVGLQEGVDFVALSFIRSEQDLEPVIKVLDAMEYPPLLIAKIEKPQAVERFEKIIAKVGGVMVARGDLGVEMSLEEVPIIQKQLIRIARQAGKPVITATQMLSSMLHNPRPTRAEATDVANAILDGTDAVMLSDETAVGSYAIEAVSFLNRIARTTEPHFDESGLLNESFEEHLPSTAAAISRAACWLAQDLTAATIVASTSSGSTARLVARFRPRSPIVALTDHVETQRQLALTWGVIPSLVESFTHTDGMFATARNWTIANGLAKKGDRLIITAGIPVAVAGTTNLLKVMEIE